MNIFISQKDVTYLQMKSINDGNKD